MLLLFVGSASGIRQWTLHGADTLCGWKCSVLTWNSGAASERLISPAPEAVCSPPPPTVDPVCHSYGLAGRTT